MSHPKRRSTSHIIEAKSKELLRSLLPMEWVVREFSPDYGIDLVVEIFDFLDERKSICETLGEFLFVQLKAVQRAEIVKEKVYSVQNVAKAGRWIEDPSDSLEIEVIKFVLDVNTLKTVQRTGSGVCILLLLADLDAQKVYFVCLNDLIDKLVLPKSQSKFETQQHLTLSIPVMNTLNNKIIGLTALKFYAKRAKLLAAFSVFMYQRNELLNLFRIKDAPVSTYRNELEKEATPTDEDIYQVILAFIASIESYDFWTTTEMWAPIRWEYDSILKLKSYLIARIGTGQNIDFSHVRSETLLIWHRLVNLNNMYQELCREWHLPKHLAQFLSSPEK